ncbi:ankyrin repeat domain-containing protein [Acidovorax radicis]|uniref:ankyrin repeat domain-containing protein n=1 Tax=Acidovorax radicis TaxID=758826 RepID=UPI0002375BA1|nr:ankyrin repeat domain-containing protein [Acidovorax radicis]
MARENNPEKADTLGKRLGMLLFSALFALAFGLGGYFAGLQPLVQTLRAALEVHSWQPVVAQVLGSELKRHTSSDGTTYQVHARYRYEFGGRQYEGTRVGLDSEVGADNIGDWHQRWHGLLQSAQSRGQPITIMVNPQVPSQALIDPSIRWALQMFRVPFALVFTGVGLAAAWMFLHTLLRLVKGAEDVEEGASPTPQPKASAGTSAGAAWFFTLFWCGIAFPMAGMLWTSGSAPWYAKAFISIFVMVGLGLVALSVRQTHLAWRYAGAALSVQPARPRAGHPVEVALLLPERAATHQQEQSPQLRLAQYRVDESSSGSPERCVESFTESARLQPAADGGLRLVARFDVPADAPPHGAQRSGERVDWRLELLHSPGGTAELTYDLPVQAAPQTFASELPDRFDRRAAWKLVTPIAPLSEHGEESEDSLPLPPSVTLQEAPHAWHYAFSQTGWRWAAGLVLAGLALEAAINGRLGTHGLVLPRSFMAATAWWVLVAFALHAATRRWALSVQDNGITVHRHSWLWTRTQTLPGQASQSFVHKLLYATGSGASEHPYSAVYARGADGTLVRITPGLSGGGAATAVGQSIAQAWAHRRVHFSPGAQRRVRTGQSRPAWGALLLAAVLAGWIGGPPLAGLARPAPAGKVAAPAAPTPPTSYSALDGPLLDAQNADDARALSAALAAGANPNLLAPSGSSLLMLAAHRGQLEHIELLLRAGALPDLRQTQKDSERGDTALLRAFYGGHLAAAQRLVQAGASLAARNRWDWGPVHMAAQSGCVPCLQWLSEQGQSLDEPAPASRGETPAMLAAAKGRIQALEWLEVRGVDLWRQDPYGKNALDWARFGKQQDAERWLVQRQR